MCATSGYVMEDILQAIRKTAHENCGVHFSERTFAMVRNSFGVHRPSRLKSSLLKTLEFTLSEFFPSSAVVDLLEPSQEMLAPLIII